VIVFVVAVSLEKACEVQSCSSDNPENHPGDWSALGITLGREKNKCHLCSYASKQKQGLRQHMKVKRHIPNHQKQQCKLCGVFLKNSGGLKRQNLLHHKNI